MYEPVERWWNRKLVVEERVKMLAVEIGADPARSLRCGNALEGFYRFGHPPKGWRAAGKKFPGYIMPNKRSVDGGAFAYRMSQLKLETCEDLAKELGLPPFFTDSTGQWCSAVGCFALDGKYYLEFPTALVRHFTGVSGVDLLKEWEYLRDKERAP